MQTMDYADIAEFLDILSKCLFLIAFRSKSLKEVIYSANSFHATRL